MSEATVMSGIQTAIQAMSEFANADVVVHDWTVLDGEVGNAPYIILEVSDEFESRQDAPSAEDTWAIKAYLYEEFVGWETTLNNFRTRRQALIDQINSSDYRTAGGLEGVNVVRVRSGTPVGEYYDPYNTAPQDPESTPIYLFQLIIFDVEEF